MKLEESNEPGNETTVGEMVALALIGLYGLFIVVCLVLGAVAGGHWLISCL